MGRNHCPGSDLRFFAMDGQCIVVHETPSLYLKGGTSIYGPLPFRGDV